MSLVSKRNGFVSEGQPSVSFVDRPDATREWRPDWPCPVRNVLAQQRRGAGDPTMRLAAPGERGPHWRASRTPEGPVTLAVESRDAAGDVRAKAWGPGAAWALDQLPDLLGAADDWTGFEARHPVVAEAWRRHPHVRLGRTARPLEALVPTIIEQKVTGHEAFAGFRALVLKYGAPAPGPAVGLRLQPDAATLVGISSWAWLGLHIDPARSRAVVTAARHADAFERIVARAPAGGRRPGPRDPEPARPRGVDERRGAAARPRRSRRGVLRRLPRSQGRRLGVVRQRDR